MTTMTHGETARVTRTYDDYRLSGVARARWAPGNVGNQVMAEERRAAMLRLLAEAGYMPGSSCRVLDAGCGYGGTLRELMDAGYPAENLGGVDLMADRLCQSRRGLPSIEFQRATLEQLPYRDGAFDVVVSFTVFSSILSDAVAARVASESARVLRPGGAILWYDMRYASPGNRNVRPVPKAALGRLFPRFEMRLESLTFVPPLTRRLGSRSAALYPLLARVPFLRTHYLGLLLKPSG
jgi:SAM-dependent methyltransferase